MCLYNHVTGLQTHHSSAHTRFPPATTTRIVTDQRINPARWERDRFFPRTDVISTVLQQFCDIHPALKRAIVWIATNT